MTPTMNTCIVGLLFFAMFVKHTYCNIALRAETLSDTELKLTVLNSPGIKENEQYYIGFSTVYPPVLERHPYCKWTVAQSGDNLHCTAQGLMPCTRYYFALQYCNSSEQCKWIANAEGFTRRMTALQTETVSETAIKVVVLNSIKLIEGDHLNVGFSTVYPPVLQLNPYCKWPMAQSAESLHCIARDLKPDTKYYIALQYCKWFGHCEWIANTEGFTSPNGF